MSPTGEIVDIWTMADIGLTRAEIDSVYYGLGWGEGYFGTWCGDYFCLGQAHDTEDEVTLLHIPTGQKEMMTVSDWETLVQDTYASHLETEELAWKLPPGDYSETVFLWDKYTDNAEPVMISAKQYETGGANDLFFLYDGTPLTEFTRKSGTWYYSVYPIGGLIEVLDLNTASYYDLKTMDCVFRTYLGYYAD